MANKPSKPRRRFRRRAGRALLILLAILLLVSTLTNFLLPDRTTNPEHLSDIDQARAKEVLQLRRAFGDKLWPGFGQADIPLVLYNESHAFLISYEGAPPGGWRDVPRENHYGGPWERVPGGEIAGLPYYRQQLPPDRTPQAFTVRVGESWAASMTLRDWTILRMGNELRDALPAPLRLFVPYRLIGRGMGSLFGTEWFISAVEHESLHAFQGQITPERLARSETFFSESGNDYPWDDPAMTEQWKIEMKILVEALKAEDQQQRGSLVHDFLSKRAERRQNAGLDSLMIQLEQSREWEEGLAKYIELAIWKAAANSTGYQPVEGLNEDPAFDHYENFEGQWERELSTMQFQGGAGESRFYYSGMAQAFLLDDLMPDWREQTKMEGICLERLLAEAADFGPAS